MGHAGDHDEGGGDGGHEVDGEPELLDGIEGGPVVFVDDESDATSTDVGESGFEAWTDLREHLGVECGGGGFALLAELLDHHAVGDLDRCCGGVAEEWPCADGREIDASCGGSIEVASHAAFDIVWHLHRQGFEAPVAGLMVLCGQCFGVEHPAVLTDGEDPDEGDAFVDVEGETHGTGVFEGEGVVVVVEETDTPHEVLVIGVSRVRLVVDGELEPSASGTDFFE